jgi:hypothetical protein
MKKIVKFFVVISMVSGVLWVHTDDFEKFHQPEVQIVASE